MKYISDSQKKSLLFLTAMSLSAALTDECNVLEQTHENLAPLFQGLKGATFPLLLTHTLCKHLVIG